VLIVVVALLAVVELIVVVALFVVVELVVVEFPSFPFSNVLDCQIAHSLPPDASASCFA
jgi:hypothetical protein